MSGLGGNVEPENCATLGALGFHSGMWYFLLYTEGQEMSDNASHVFLCHYCKFERRGRPNDDNDTDPHKHLN